MLLHFLFKKNIKLTKKKLVILNFFPFYANKDDDVCFVGYF